jgi:hypothetical protein
MAIADTFKSSLGEYTLKDEKYGISFNRVVAERKVFLSKKKLEYSGKIKIDEEKKEVVFSDMLKESGSGLSMGNDSDMGSGFGFSASTYSMGMNGRSGTIEEQSTLFGKKYSYTFKYDEVRKLVEDICNKEGYAFKYSIF